MVKLELGAGVDINHRMLRKNLYPAELNDYISAYQSQTRLNRAKSIYFPINVSLAVQILRRNRTSTHIPIFESY